MQTLMNHVQSLKLNLFDKQISTNKNMDRNKKIVRGCVVQDGNIRMFGARRSFIRSVHSVPFKKRMCKYSRRVDCDSL